MDCTACTVNLNPEIMKSVSVGAAKDLSGNCALVTGAVGLPSRLDGTASDMTPRVQAFAVRLGERVGLPISLQDERLSSREAESRLAIREKNWRVRKQRLDAAAAAVILQDYLDSR
jgi:putative Holliday junction resolvase